MNAKTDLQLMDRVHQILSAVQSIFIVLDDNWEIKFWNLEAEKTFGIFHPEAENKRVFDLKLKLDWAPLKDGITACTQTKQTVYVDDLDFTTVKGKPGFLGITINPLLNGSSSLEGIIILGKDITQRKITEGQAAQSQKLESVGQLAAGVAHEINTPIQFIGDNLEFINEICGELTRFLEKMEKIKLSETEENLGNIRTWMSNLDLPYIVEEVPKAVAEALDGVHRVAKIVKALKNFSHMQPGKMVSVNINESIGNTVTISRSEWKYIADMVLELDPDIPPLECYADEINQVILNIIINASQALQEQLKDETGAKGRITIKSIVKKNNVLISIGDSGPGIPGPIREKIFDPFFTTKEVNKGTGQGLAISYDIVVKKHKGRIYVESKEGEGSTFFIELPLVISKE